MYSWVLSAEIHNVSFGNWLKGIEGFLICYTTNISLGTYPPASLVPSFSTARYEATLLARYEATLLARYEATLLARYEATLLARYEATLLARYEATLLARYEATLLATMLEH